MADQDTPLTEAERAELEQLRAEKARRERAELEQLRAEQAESDAAKAATIDDSRSTPAAPAPTSSEATADKSATTQADASSVQAETPARPSASEATRPASQPSASSAQAAGTQERPRTFGERMVLSEGEDEDGVPSMPPAQKLIIAIALLAFVCGAVYVALVNTGVLG
ncbi:hypothetical protein [Collinsella sp. An2]|uniref:hypothetical protein n=1 Tax=Collinsella sp. An2 TaxID=1965585 RepID=UPI000B397765|nr:hypothetical protein [Collinsella sp. An2]OUP08451.1 hypothetical protein B5F33_07060 [Collinsella sp. An2]